MSAIEFASSTEAIELRLAPLRRQLANHPLYEQMRTLHHVRLFMQSHVFAVWDFMSLLKSLQRTLTCVELPWTPTRFPASRRFVNEIVLGEESDLYHGRPISHFELYLEAMQQVQADTRPIQQIINRAGQGIHQLHFEAISRAAKDFVETTFRVICEGSPAAQAAVFAFGREDAIPGMFRSLVRQLNQEMSGQLDKFVWYLERHIEVDGSRSACAKDSRRSMWQRSGPLGRGLRIRRRSVARPPRTMGWCAEANRSERASENDSD